MCGGHVCGSLGGLEPESVQICIQEAFCAYQVIELDGGNTLVDTRDDLHGDGSSVDMVRIEAVTQPGDTSCDLVELNTLLTSI